MVSIMSIEFSKVKHIQSQSSGFKRDVTKHTYVTASRDFNEHCTKKIGDTKAEAQVCVLSIWTISPAIILWINITPGIMVGQLASRRSISSIAFCAYNHWLYTANEEGPTCHSQCLLVVKSSATTLS